MGTLADLMGNVPASDGSQMDLFKWYDQFRDSPWPPRRLWPADLERTDTERILYYQGNALALRNGELWVAGSNGLWAPGKTERGKASLRDRIISGREAAREELRNNQPLLDLEDWWYQLDVRQRHWNAVLVNVCDYLQARGQSVHDIPAVPDARWDSQRGVVPVLDPVGALDLKDGGQFLNPDQLLPMYVEDRGWEIPVPDLYAPIHTDAWDIIDQRYGWTLAERMAAALLGPGKNIDAIIVEMPNWGKDAWISWLELCLPGAVAQFPNSAVLSERGNRFSQAYYPLTQSVLVFFNECDKLDRNIPPGTLNAMVADRLVIELKYANPRDIKRVGTPVFVGNGKPVLDGTQLGTDARFQWAYWPSEAEQEDVGPMWSGQRDMALGDDAVKGLRDYLFQQAIKLWETHGVDYLAAMTDQRESDNARAMIYSEEAEIRDAFLESIQPADGYWESSADLQALVKDISAPMWSLWLKRACRNAGVEPRQKVINQNGKRIRGWQGVRIVLEGG